MIIRDLSNDCLHCHKLDVDIYYLREAVTNTMMKQTQVGWFCVCLERIEE